MTKKSMQYFFAAPILAALLIGSTAFTTKAKDITNGEELPVDIFSITPP